jgi:hypothetical protein
MRRRPGRGRTGSDQLRDDAAGGALLNVERQPARDNGLSDLKTGLIPSQLAAPFSHPKWLSFPTHVLPRKPLP